MIIEGILSTTDEAGQPHWAAMGPIIDESASRIELRPFQPSLSLDHLERHPFGVFHLVDDSRLIAESAIKRLSAAPTAIAAGQVSGFVLQNCCRWFEFKVTHLDRQSQRASVQCEIIATGEGRPFRGMNRATFANIEAAILATRIDFLPGELVQTEFERLHKIVDKTGDADEMQVFAMLSQHVRQS